MPTPRSEGALGSGLVRIRAAGGGAAGAGFLVASDIVCTCAHVVTDALGLPRDVGRAPDDTVVVEFPLLRDADGVMPAVRAEVVSWKPVRDDDSGDVALLRLERPVPVARPVPLVDGTAVWGHAFRAYGFPDGAEHGVWASGTLRAAQGTGWVQMDAGPGGARIEAGFSGAAVWDDAQGGVIGMTVAAGRGRLGGTAYLVPSAALVDEEVLRPQCPFRGLAVFEEEDAKFFHGREDDTERLRKAVALRPLTVLAGPSGCGKSSLVRAGLLPALRAAGTTVTVLRPVPGVLPETVLAQAVVPVLEPESGEVARLSRAEELAGLLREGLRGGRVDETAAGLRAALRARGGAGGAGGHLLFVDQLEEYAGAEPAAARELFTLLATVAGAPEAGAGAEHGNGLRVVATARSGSLEALATPRTSDALSDGVLFLTPLAADGLLRAVTGPIDAVPGVWLEPGLAERIVEDAGDEPGRMPLVEFTLTRLWEKREQSMLTHAAYQELGGVAGALVGYAEDVISTHVPAGQESVAQRLFAQLARPDDRGGFTRRATPVADLGAPLMALARRLAPGKLVIFARTPEGTEIVDLAHEALIRLWPRLRDWLTSSREFREWQEQVRRDMARWEEQGKDTGGLLRGRVLATAVDWVERRPEEVTVGERAYVKAGMRHERRGVRRWQAAAAALLTLVMAAAALAVRAESSQRDTEAKLRTLASRTLAAESDLQTEHNPSTAVQLALAAWHTEQTPEAREALLRQYVRGQYLRGIHAGLWRGPVKSLDATPDGRTLVVHSDPAGDDPLEASVITGALSETPRHYRLRGLPEGESTGAVSPDGRHYAVATEDGSVRLWNLKGPNEEPMVLTGRATGERVVTASSVDFSADSGRLLRLLHYNKSQPEDEGRQAFLDVWSVDSGEQLPVSDDVVPASGYSPEEVAFGRDPNTVVMVMRYEDYDSSDNSVTTTDRATILELRTGRTVRKIAETASGGSMSLGGGAYVVEQRERRKAGGNDPYVYVHEIATGTSSLMPSGAVLTDTTGSYLMEDKRVEDSGKESYSEIALTRLPTGDTYRTRVPNDIDADPKVAAVPQEGGGVTVLAAVGDTLMTTAAEPGVVTTDRDRHLLVDHAAMSPDGRRVARVLDSSRLEVEDSVRGGHETAALPPTDQPDLNWHVAWTEHSAQLLLWQPEGTRLAAYDADDLTRRTDVSLDAGPDTGKPRGMIDAVAPLEGGDAAVLTVGGALLRVDPERGVQTGTPLKVDSTRVDPAERFAPYGRLLARPGHPHEVAAVTRNGMGQGTVLLWNVRERKQTGVLSGDKITPPLDVGDGPSMAFSTDGEELVVQHEDGYLQRWNVDEQRTSGPRIPTSPYTELIGMTDEGMVITETDVIELRDADTGARAGAVPVIDVLGGTRILLGNQLIKEYAGWRQSYIVSADAWFRRLCAAASRDYTDSERNRLLPPGTPPEPPCTGVSPR
ncbi:trypsin-like peptidase domain-containing protein [Streptomyces sp. 35G-GA-8]|uniref:nSTAND1 domain-containing NTPase n=1 Tax=Streptomyces sp. 35G-GA-8 TaxID=2939434 RepID=UPI00201E8DAF|nr:trypsin-like peptidase domain-containing protein [Streptomyces sp. 35G-GA-8]MCL7380570.1 trypsin-like peptidase domain-containing protein [Streptomyces sp. 35G-GA-8]